MDKRIVAALAAALALAAGPAAGNDAEVVNVVGKGEARAPAREDWQAAIVKQRLPGGTFVRTGDRSQMALLLSDQTQLRLNQNSMVQLKESPAGAPTRLEMRSGRAWMQSRQPANGVVVETPNATAAIRGTDWEIEVDPAGKTTIAVFTGAIELYNEQGRVTVGRNEGAVAERGRAPVKVLLTRPRDRIQWVNALAIDPGHYGERARHSPQVRAAIEDAGRGEVAQAAAKLEAERARRTPEAAAYLMLSDIALVSGEFERALAVTREGLAVAPGHPDLLAQQVRVELLMDDVAAAQRTLKVPRSAETASILVAEGETARREGLAEPALRSFERATRVAPGDDRGWFSLGRAQAEREDIPRARANLLKAIELNPRGAGYQGELGTLETFADRFGAADRAFTAALADNPADYVALTGLGLLRLKQGNPTAALEALLRAGVVEPRYARAKTYTAVAYYQLGRHADAEAMLRQAAEIDDKDPLPYFLLTQIYTDLMRAGDAVQASREGLERLPYLKSLNQLANNQQGTANLGFSLAFFGLEDWALEVAQRSYDPYAGNTHLFLADRYRGSYDRTSELLQGFLTDPLAFGGSNRFSTLVPSLGHYRTLGYSYSFNRDDYGLGNPYLRLNGLVDFPRQSAYFVDIEKGIGTTPTGNFNADGSKILANERAELYAVGLGTLVTDSLGLFAYGSKFRDAVVWRDLNATVGIADNARLDVGARYRFGPRSMTWLKVGRAHEARTFDRYFFVNDEGTILFGGQSSFKSSPRDWGLRHTMDLPGDHRVSVGVEGAKDRAQDIAVFGGTSLIADVLVVQGIGRRGDVESKQAYLSYERDVFTGLALQADVYWQDYRLEARQTRITDITIDGDNNRVSESFSADSRTRKTNPRIGLAWQGPHVTLRGAWQRWIRPASNSTLSPVATAGIPLDPRLVLAGGRIERAAVQGHVDFGPSTHVKAFYDRAKIDNRGEVGFNIPVPEIQFLDLLRNAQVVNVAAADPLEGNPRFDAGRITSYGVGVEHILSKEWSIAARYMHNSDTATRLLRNDAGDLVAVEEGLRIPFIARNVGIVGVTWISPLRIYLSAQAVHRSGRFGDPGNTRAGFLESDTTGLLAAFWESRDKRLIVGAGAGNLGSKARSELYAVDVRLRF